MKDPKVPFAIFEPYMSDENVTDLNYNGKDLWIDHLNKGRFVLSEYLDENTVMHACVLFSNLVNQHFNIQKPLLEAERSSPVYFMADKPIIALILCCWKLLS